MKLRPSILVSTLIGILKKIEIMNALLHFELWMNF